MEIQDIAPLKYGYCCYNSHYSIEKQKKLLTKFAEIDIANIIEEDEIHPTHHNENKQLVALLNKVHTGDIIVFSSRFIFVEDPKKDLDPLIWLESEAHTKGVILWSILDGIKNDTYLGRLQFGSFDNYYNIQKEFAIFTGEKPNIPSFILKFPPEKIKDILQLLNDHNMLDNVQIQMAMGEYEDLHKFNFLCE
ncbi:MAG TPA: hypothetical protein PKD85_01845 [Saprospiraceae bacterium]|nr:hypothetical protein [Saprospiraceae bacterium]